MRKTKEYGNTRFTASVIRKALERHLTITGEEIGKIKPLALRITIKDETWNYTSADQFFNEYQTADNFELWHNKGNNTFDISGSKNNVRVSIDIDNRVDVETIFEIFDSELQNSKVVTKNIKSPIGKEKVYNKTHFPTTTIQKTYETFLSKIGQEGSTDPAKSFSISNGTETWNYATISEFIANYNSAEKFVIEHEPKKNHSFQIHGNIHEIEIKIKLPTREDIESMFQIFETDLAASKITLPPSQINIFIGHGRNPQWRDLKDHLHDQFGYNIKAYEIGAKPGLSIKEVLESMLNQSSMAILVLTGEDIDEKGDPHARENVIHELGLFQGKLGFEKTCILLEVGVNEFSNIQGINQIRFSKDNIKETFGDVLATINREFGDA